MLHTPYADCYRCPLNLRPDAISPGQPNSLWLTLLGLAGVAAGEIAALVALARAANAALAAVVAGCDAVINLVGVLHDAVGTRGFQAAHVGLANKVVAACRAGQPLCGGCQWQDLAYGEQLHWKKIHVQECLQHLAGLRPGDILPPVASPQRTGAPMAR